MSTIYQSRFYAQDVPTTTRSTFKNSSLFPLRVSKFNRNDRDSTLDLGSLRSAGLAHLINPSESSLTTPVLKNLAVTHNNKIILNEQTIRELQEKYPTDYIAFYALYGKAKSGKSFWCDRTYDLCEVGSGAHYYGQNQSDKGIYFLNVPFTKGDIKIFLLDCSGFDNPHLTRAEEIRLDTIMTLSSAVLILPEPGDKNCDILPVAYDHFAQSQKRLRYFDQEATKGSNYWPHSCYCLYRGTEPVNKGLEDLGNLFNDYNFSIVYDAKNPRFSGRDKQLMSASFLDVHNSINDQYMHHVSFVTKDVYDKIWGKKLGNLMSNGRVISKLLPYLTKSLNAREKVPMEKIFDDTTRALYDDTFKRSSIFYGQAVKDAFKDVDIDRPLPSNTLLNQMNEARDKTYHYFDVDAGHIDPDSHHFNEAENKLDEIMASQEYKLMDLNKKNTIKNLEQNLPRSKDSNIQTTDDFRAYLKKLRKADPELDQGRPEVITERLKEACDEEKKKIFIISEEAEKINDLERENQRRKDQILALERDAREKQQSSLKNKQQLTILRLKSSKLDQQIDRLKQTNEKEQEIIDNPDLEEAQRLRLEQLRKSKLQLEERVRDAQRQRDQFSNWHDDRENLNREIIISNLLSKISDKRKDKESSKTKFIQSQISSKLVVSGMRAAERRPIRDDIQIKRSRIA